MHSIFLTHTLHLEQCQGHQTYDENTYPEKGYNHANLKDLAFFFFTTVLSQWDFSHGKFGLLTPQESQLRQSRATQPTVHAGCFSVSIIHPTLTWTTGPLTCAQILMHAIAYGRVRTHIKESSLKVNSGRKIPCHTRESNLHQRRDGQML